MVLALVKRVAGRLQYIKGGPKKEVGSSSLLPDLLQWEDHLESVPMFPRGGRDVHPVDVSRSQLGKKASCPLAGGLKTARNFKIATIRHPRVCAVTGGKNPRKRRTYPAQFHGDEREGSVLRPHQGEGVMGGRGKKELVEEKKKHGRRGKAKGWPGRQIKGKSEEKWRL